MADPNIKRIADELKDLNRAVRKLIRALDTRREDTDERNIEQVNDDTRSDSD